MKIVIEEVCSEPQMPLEQRVPYKRFYVEEEAIPDSIWDLLDDGYLPMGYILYGTNKYDIIKLWLEQKIKKPIHWIEGADLLVFQEHVISWSTDEYGIAV